MLITVNDAKVRSENHSSIYLILSFLFQSLLSLFLFVVDVFPPPTNLPTQFLEKRLYSGRICVFACLLASFSFRLEVTGCEAG